MIAAVRIRGPIGIRKEVKDTLKMLNLHKKHFCVLLDNNPEKVGMLQKAKDFITWGEVSDEVVSELKSKRDKGKKWFSLNSPKGGFERKGIKTPHTRGGALGYRKDKINDLIKKMI
jgi:large subunit ribosomal protein L30